LYLRELPAAQIVVREARVAVARKGLLVVVRPQHIAAVGEDLHLHLGKQADRRGALELSRGDFDVGRSTASQQRARLDRGASGSAGRRFGTLFAVLLRRRVRRGELVRRSWQGACGREKQD